MDAAFGVHHNYRSHSEELLSLGKGTIYGSSTNQKLNTRSSTEAELVAVDDLMPQILWTKLFLEAQDFTVNDNILFQDNMSAIKLEENGKMSSGKKTRHLNVRYYFITDQVSKGNVLVKYCPTNMLIADFYTKPLQGKLFRIFQDIMLNIEDTTITDYVEKGSKINDKSPSRIRPHHIQNN